MHFCEWEDETLLAQAVRRQWPPASFVCRDGDGTILGAVIAGSVGVRGTISHVARGAGGPPPRHRSRMVRRSLAAFREGGIRRVFLFVVADAASAGPSGGAGVSRDAGGIDPLEADL